MVEINMENLTKESWYKSRRVWGSVLSSITLASLYAFPEYAAIVGSFALTVSVVLGLNSWVVPKK